MNTDKRNETAAEQSGSSEGRKSTPYQRIVIACPENHIIVVKRFINGGKRLASHRVKEIDKIESPIKSINFNNLKSRICSVPVQGYGSSVAFNWMVTL